LWARALPHNCVRCRHGSHRFDGDAGLRDSQTGDDTDEQRQLSGGASSLAIISPALSSVTKRKKLFENTLARRGLDVAKHASLRVDEDNAVSGRIAGIELHFIFFVSELGCGSPAEWW
jgi:hypothetical protein